MATYRMTSADRAARARTLREKRDRQLKYMQARRTAGNGQGRTERDATEKTYEESGVAERVGATAADIGVQLGGGLVKGLEGIVDAGTTLVGAVGGLFSEDFRDTAQDVVAYDFTGEHIMNPAYEAGTKKSYLYEGKAGEIAQSVVHGIGNMLPAVAVAAIPGLGQAAGAASLATMAVGAGGNATEEAYRDGADYYAGAAYGAVSGGIEAATEKLTGGLTTGVFGKGWLDDVLKVGDVASTGVGRVVKGVGEEAAEEAISELADPLAKSIYKGKDAFSEYSEPTYWSGVGEAALVGGLTSLAYGATVGKMTHTSGKDADIRNSLEAIDNVTREQVRLQKNGNLTEQARERLRSSVEGNLKNIERTLQKAKPRERASLTERYGLRGIVDDTGAVKADVATFSLSERRTEDRAAQSRDARPSEVDETFAMSREDLRGQSTRDARELRERSAADEESGDAVSARDGVREDALSETARVNLRQFKKAVAALSDSAERDTRTVIVERNADLDDTVQRDGNAVYVTEDALESGAWVKASSSEVARFPKTSTEYKKLLRALAESGDKTEGLDTAVEKYEQSIALSDAETQVVNEATERMANEVLDDERLIERLVRRDARLAEKLIGRIRALSNVLRQERSVQARTEYERLQRAEKRYLAAVERAGYRYIDGRIARGGADVSEKGADVSPRALQREVREAQTHNDLVNRALDRLQGLRDLKLGTYHNASSFNDGRFRGSIEHLSALKQRGVLRDGSARKYFGDLLAWYTPQNALFAEREGFYRQEVYDMMEAIARGEGKLSDNDLRYTIKVTEYLTHLVKNYNKVYVGERYVDAVPLAKEYVKNTARTRGVQQGVMSRVIGSRYMLSFADPLTLMRYMDGYHEKGFYTETFRSFQNGAVTVGVTEMELSATYEDFLAEHKHFKKSLTADSVIYRENTIPMDLAISLYMTSKRGQARAGLVKSGFVMEIDGERVRFAPLGEAGRQYTAQEMKALCDQMAKELYSRFSKEGKQFISLMEACYNGRCAELKANVDLVRFGYTNVAQGEYYYPIVRANIAESIDGESYFEAMDRVDRLSINKETVKGAAGELLIRPSTDTFRQHVQQIALYHGLAVPTDNFNCLFNLNIASDPNKPTSVRSETEATEIGRRTNEYIRALKGDIEGAPKRGDEKGAFQRAFGFMRGSYAKYQLGLNPKTWITQLSSLAAAENILDADVIVKSLGVNGSDVDEWCGLAKLRNRDNSAALAQGTLERVGRLGSLTMKPIGQMDRFVIKRLFGACQLQIEKDGGAMRGTADNKRAAGKLLERVILETQQNSLATERSGAMRSDNELLRSLTMFSADSMKTFGRFLDAVGEVSALQKKLKAGDQSQEVERRFGEQLKRARKQVGRAVASLVTQAVFMAGIAMTFRWLYGRDRDMEPSEKSKTFALDVIGNMLSGLPILRDVYSYFSDGFEVEHFLYATVNDMLGAVNDSVSLATDAAQGKEVSDWEVRRTIRRAVYAGGQLFGLPVRNVYNFGTGIVSRISADAEYRINGLFAKQNYSADLNAALEAGDDKTAAMIAGLMLDESTDYMSDEVREAIRPLVEAGYSVLPRAVGDTMTHNGEEIVLTRTQKARFQKIYEAADEAVERLIALSAFQNASQEEQAMALRFIWDTYLAWATDEALETDSESKSVLLAKAIDIEKLALFTAVMRTIGSDTDGNGHAVLGSKKAKIVSYLSSLRLTAAQKYILMCYAGYASGQDRNSEREIGAYVNQLSMSDAEKDTLLAYCGYD